MSDPELRVDPLSGITVVIAPGRKGLAPPGAPSRGTLPALEGACPFCPGQERELETVVHEELDAQGVWQVRVMRNRYPLVRPELASARGVHEVIIETREHEGDLATLSDGAALRVLRACRARARALAGERSARALILFRNRGRGAGSSQPHPHAQIVALPYVPPDVERRARMAAKAFRTHGVAALTLALERERRDGSRIVSDADGVVTYCPYASLRAYETRIAVSSDVARLADVSDALLAHVAIRLRDAAAALARVTGGADYNVLVRDPPLRARRGAFFTIDLVPRTGGYAGFELASGSSVCVVAPETTAAALRAASRGSVLEPS